VLLAYQVKSKQEVRLIRVWAVTAVTPLARVTESFRSNVAHFFSDYFVLLDVREDNKRMKAEMDRIKMENQFLRTELSTADRARSLAIFQSRSPSRTVAAHIIGNTTGSGGKVVIVDRGTVSGIEKGADVSVGPSMYRTERQTPDSSWMLAAALPSWSLMVARTPNGHAPRAGCVMAHNVALRRSVFQQHAFRTGTRSFSSALLYYELVRSGVKISFQPEQTVAHTMTFGWWLGRKHFRTGWETYFGRGADKDWPRIPVLEKTLRSNGFTLPKR
jgi:hypothetical protein